MWTCSHLAAPAKLMLSCLVALQDQLAAALPSYELGEELGRGSTGVVLSAEHRQLGGGWR